jgi:hypothetical protein
LIGMGGRRSELRRLALCVALTIAAHAAVLALPVRSAATAGSVTQVAAMRVRSIEAPQPAVPPIVEWDGSVVEATLEHVVRAARESARDDAALPQTPPIALEPIAAPSAVLLNVPGWSLPGAADEDDVFIARWLLAVPPAPLAPVIISHPDFAGMAGRYSGELTLYIDETGTVVRVRAEAGALPPALEEAARSAFMSVRFRPGELAEHGAVKSRIRVEVVFEGGAPLQLG